MKNKKKLIPEFMPQFDEGIKNMSDYSRGRVDGMIQLCESESGIYNVMDTYCIESLSPEHYEVWLTVLNALSLSREKAKIFTERMGYLTAS